MDEGEVELTMLWQVINQSKLNIVGLEELNTCWDVVDYVHQLPQQTRGWWETVHWSLGFTYWVLYQLRKALYQYGNLMETSKRSWYDTQSG